MSQTPVLVDSGLSATELATILTAAFTAIAAAAAAWASVTTWRRARAQSEPFIAVGLPRLDEGNWGFHIPLKNLGLGPARTIALAVILDGERQISARVGMGLAPMESDDWFLYAVDWHEQHLPAWHRLTINGNCTDASGKSRPIHFSGFAPMPIPEAAKWHSTGDEAEPEELAAQGIVLSFQLELRKGVQAQRAGVDRRSLATGWRGFWIEATREELDRSDDFTAWARGEWERMGGSPENFMTAAEADSVLAEDESDEPAS